MALQRIYPIQHFCSWSIATGIGTHTAAGVWTDATTGDCYSYADDLAGALDETDYGICRSSSSAGTRDNGRAEFTFGDPPQNCTFVSLTVVAWLRTSNGGAAIIDSSPTLQMFVDPGTGTRTYQTGTQTVTAAVNRNTQAPAGTFQKLTYTWTTKPAGGAWTRAELLSGSFKAGFESSATSGHGSGVDATTGGSSASLDWANVYVEFETTPTGLFVEPNRVVMSHGLRVLSAGQRTLDIEVGPEFGDIEPGDTVWCSHELLPWSPGTDPWKQVGMLCAAVRDRFDPPGRVLTLWDLREVQASFWSPFRIIGVDDQKTGLAVYHRGGGWSTVRNQVAYGKRPGDGLYGAAAANTPLLTKDGLLIQGGDDVNYLLSSTFSQGTGSTFTSWTKTVSGSATVTEDLADYLIDVVGLQRSAKATTTAATENAYLSQTSASHAANTKLFVRVKYKNDSGNDQMIVKITRAIDGWSWNGTTWQAGGFNHTPALSRSIADWVSTQIDVGAGATTVTVNVGYAAVAAAAVGHLYSCELQLGTTFAWCRRDILPTTTTTITRVATITAADNSVDYRVWQPARGFFRVAFVPQWGHVADLADGESRIVITAAFDGLVGNQKHICGYQRTNSTSGIWIFTVGFAAGAQLSVSGGGLPVAGSEYVIAGRWTSAATNEWGLAGQALDIWVNGVRGTTSPSNTQPTEVSGSTWIGVGYDPASTGAVDGHLRNLVIDTRCPSDSEMARM